MVSKFKILWPQLLKRWMMYQFNSKTAHAFPPGQIPQCVVRLGPVYMEVVGPGRWGNLLRWSKTPTHKFSCFNLIKFTWFVGWPYIRDYMNRRVTSPKRATLPTWVPPPPCKQTLRWSITLMASASKSVKWPTQQRLFKHFPTPQTVYSNINATEICLWPVFYPPSKYCFICL